MVSEPTSVPAARHFLNDVLAGWDRDHLADDSALCVSELATNATLHGVSPYFQTEMYYPIDGSTRHRLQSPLR